MSYPFAFTPDALEPAPFPHLLCQPFLDPDLYARLRAELPPDRFFEGGGSAYGRTARDLYRGDPLFGEFLAGAPAWREFYERVNSPAFLELARQLFGSHLARFGCRIDAEKMRYSDYLEPRNELAEPKGLEWLRRVLRARIDGGVDPEELFVRFDLGQAGVGYGKRVHCDLPKRLCSMIIYFSDAEEPDGAGGELLLYEHRENKAPTECERYPRGRDVRVIQTVTPRENLGLFFLCSNNSYHGVRPVQVQSRYRTFVYINLSSRSQRIWP